MVGQDEKKGGGTAGARTWSGRLTTRTTYDEGFLNFKCQSSSSSSSGLFKFGGTRFSYRLARATMPPVFAYGGGGVSSSSSSGKVVAL